MKARKDQDSDTSQASCGPDRCGIEFASPPEPITERGLKLLQNPALNKSTAFTLEERERYGLTGLLPPTVCPQDVQIKRVLENMRRKNVDLEKFIFLQALAARNQRLFYRLMLDHIEEILPLIYTPTVGQACKEFAHIFRQTRGLYITANDRGQVAKLIDNWPYRDVRAIVMTDGERILGLGDLGANGMGIPIGKLALYTGLAGIEPDKTLPIMLDIGTNNAEIRNDPLYLGLNQPRLRGDAYFELVDEVVDALQAAYPCALLQFEDFATPNAYALLNRYRNRVQCFNDDIQGTAAMALGGLLASTRISGIDFSDLRILFVGAGSAATGIADLMAEAFVDEGLSEEEARQRLWFVDVDGLVVAERRDSLLPHNLPYAHKHPRTDLLGAVESIKPQVLIGATGVAGSFTQPVIEKMAELNEKPAIFALSNPTANAECTAEQAYRWSKGRAIFASGSPFGPVELDGRTFRPGQSNNAYIFPGIGLGAVYSGARVLTDDMFLTAARVLASAVGECEIASGTVYPPLRVIREISIETATRITRLAQLHGLTGRSFPEDIASSIRGQLYDPTY